jgi:hypothetical protein
MQKGEMGAGKGQVVRAGGAEGVGTDAFVLDDVRESGEIRHPRCKVGDAAFNLTSPNPSSSKLSARAKGRVEGGSALAGMGRTTRGAEDERGTDVSNAGLCLTQAVFDELHSL